MESSDLSTEIPSLDHNARIASTIKMYGCKVHKIIQKVHHAYTQADYIDDVKISIARLLSGKDLRTFSNKEKIKQKNSAPSRDFGQIVDEVVQQTYRAIESFMIIECSRALKPISVQLLKQALPYLSNFRKALPQEDAITFLSFLKATYGLSIIYVSQHFVGKLVLALMLLLKKKIKRGWTGDRRIRGAFSASKPNAASLFKKLTQTDRLNQVWNQRMERLLVNSVKQNEYFFDIRDQFRTDFPDIKEIITVQSLKNRFFKILRAGLKKLRLLQAEGRGLQPLSKLDDTKVKYILRSGEGVKVRRCLVHVYAIEETEEGSRQRLLNTTIQSINNFMIE